MVWVFIVWFCYALIYDLIAVIDSRFFFVTFLSSFHFPACQISQKRWGEVGTSKVRSRDKLAIFSLLSTKLVQKTSSSCFPVHSTHTMAFFPITQPQRHHPNPANRISLQQPCRTWAPPKGSGSSGRVSLCCAPSPGENARYSAKHRSRISRGLYFHCSWACCWSSIILYLSLFILLHSR